jgi:hypothetical protein
VALSPPPTSGPETRKGKVDNALFNCLVVI